MTILDMICIELCHNNECYSTYRVVCNFVSKCLYIIVICNEMDINVILMY